MKIVFASYVYTPGFNTPEDWLNRTLHYGGILCALAKNNNVISIEQIDYEGTYLKHGVQYYFKPWSKTGNHFPVKQHLFIKSLNPDVVFIHGLHYSLQIIQLRLVLGKKVKIMVQHHSEHPATGIKKIVQQLADRCINAYLFASRDMGLEWVRKGNLNTAAKVYGVMEVSSSFYPVNKQKALAKTGINGAPIFLWVGRLNQNKDPLNVVKAFIQFAQINTSARLYMVYATNGLLPQILELLDQNPHLKDSIILIGKIPHPELLYWFNSADFIISGSFYEAAGTVICEAMSCGVVPIVTDIPSFRMMTDNGKCGLIYEAGNQQALLNCLLQTMRMKPVQMQKEVLTFYQDNLSFEAIADKISGIASSL